MTLAEFRDFLANQLGIKGRGNTLSDDDANYLEEIVQNCQEELEAIEVATWTIDDIPRKVANSLVIYCKADISRFGFDPNPELKALGLMQIRYIESDPRHGVGTADYF